MVEKFIRDWKIVPVTGGEICLVGMVAEILTTTTVIVGIRKGQMKTESGTIYNLQARNPGMWELQLEMKRPSKYANLRQAGII